MVDLDVLFSYKTIKIVTIQDRRLGILHYIFKIAILFYIIVYTLIIQQRYLLTEPPYGSIRATVQQPQGTAWLPANNYTYCAQSQPASGNFTNYPCIYLLGYDIVYPPAPLNSIFVSTRIKDATFAAPAGCPSDTYVATSVNCVAIQTSTTNYFTAGVEDFTLFIEHAIYGRLTNTKRSNSGLKGTLNFQGSSKTLTFDGPRTGDIFPISTLLEAAGINSLDVLSGLVNSTKSLRYDGALLMMVITYSNSPRHPSQLSYTYDVNFLSGEDVVAMEPTIVWSASNTTTERNHHGINVQFIVAGSVGRFDFPTFLLTLVSALVLLNVSTAIVDLLLIYVMPDKQKYKEHKFELTEDFSDVRQVKMQKYGDS